MGKRLYRSQKEKVIGGVCGGLAEYFDLDPTLVRLATVLLVLGLGFPILAYLVGWIIIPRQPYGIDESASSTATSSTPAGPSYSAPSQPSTMAETTPPKERSQLMRILPGALLIAFGALAMLRHQLWWDWGDMAPVALILVGLYVLLRGANSTGGASEKGQSTETTTTTPAPPPPPPPTSSPSGPAPGGEATLSTNGGEL